MQVATWAHVRGMTKSLAPQHLALLSLGVVSNPQIGPGRCVPSYGLGEDRRAKDSLFLVTTCLAANQVLVQGESFAGCSLQMPRDRYAAAKSAAAGAC